MQRTALLIIAVFTVLLGISTVRAELYGESLGETEQRAVANTFQYSLENNKSGTAATWNNPDSEQSGSTVPLRTYQTAEGLYCREYQQLIVVAGEEEVGFGTACREPDGSWRILDADKQSEVSEVGSKETRVDDYRTYRYYSPWTFAYPYSYRYFPHHISFSYSFIHRDGHYYSGHKHHFRGHKHNFRGHKHNFRGHKHNFRGHKHSFRGHNHSFRGHNHSFRGHNHSFRGHNHSFRGHKGHVWKGKGHTWKGKGHSWRGKGHGWGGKGHGRGGKGYGRGGRGHGRGHR